VCIAPDRVEALAELETLGFEPVAENDSLACVRRDRR
jgi:hypothetical protein